MLKRLFFASFIFFFLIVLPAKAEVLDSDKDGLSDVDEMYIYHTDPQLADTDGDGYLDGLEVDRGFDPLNSSTEKIAKKIEVDLKTQTLVYYFGDKKMDEFLISSGIPSLPTPRGQFEILKKKPIINYSGPGYYLPNTKWNLLFTYKGGLGVFVHGAYWHNNFGHPMSHGCVNVAYSNMEDLYNFSEVGTKVVIR